jgi:hypothetical protein
MGDLRSDNGSGWPDDGGSQSHDPKSNDPTPRPGPIGRPNPAGRNDPPHRPDGSLPQPAEITARVVPSHDDRYGLPDLPSDWGPIVIPDDAAELAAEASALRRERRRIARQSQLRRLLGRPPLPSTSGGQPSVGVPLVIMAVAILTTMISLFVVTWGRDTGNPSGQPAVSTAATQPTAAAGVKSLSELTLPDASGTQVRFGSLLPAVVLMVDGCACDRLITDLASATPSGVSVIPVGRTAPHLTGMPANVRALSDPDGALRARLAADDATDSAATAVLLDASATITATVARVDSYHDITAQQLARIIA